MHAEPTQAFVHGDVLNYQPDPTRFMPRHCREGIAVVNEHGRAVDTFWMSGNDHVLTEDELAGATLRFRLSDFHTIQSEHEWLKYAPEDRRTITRQHGYQATYYVRDGAVPDLETQIVNAREKVEEAERGLSSAESRLRWAREDLAKLEAQRA